MWFREAACVTKTKENGLLSWNALNAVAIARQTVSSGAPERVENLFKAQENEQRVNRKEKCCLLPGPQTAVCPRAEIFLCVLCAENKWRLVERCAVDFSLLTTRQPTNQMP